MVELSAEQFAQRAFDVNLLDERQLQDVWAHIGSRQISRDELQQLLVRRELLTSFQAERLLRGDRSGYFYGNYKVLYLVGTGTFARVYRAAHKDTGQIMAVKVLRNRYSKDEEEAERFYREGTMGSTLRHPNIVPIFEVHSEAGLYYLVMEFVEGRNLREFIKIRKKFDAREATRIVTDIAAGLDYAFGRGICHRDLKMSNVLVSSRGQAKLVDFGLAAADKNLSDEALADCPNPRTIDYAGLERATGVRKDDPRSDIYFLGSIYYHILTGIPPIFETRDRSQRLSKTRFQSVTPIEQVDTALQRPVVQIVTKAMDLDVNKRYQSPGEMLADLQMALRRLGEANGATAGSASAQPQRSLMFVEANVDMQNVFRERLKTSGYRVLVTRDPDRALGRFAEDAAAADCVIFSTGALGEPALDAFNRLAENRATARVPAVLLLGEEHESWKERAKLDRHRVAISMPIKLKEFRHVLSKLLP